MDRAKALELLKLLYPEWKPIALMYCCGNKMVLPRDQTGRAQSDPLSSAIMGALILALKSLGRAVLLARVATWSRVAGAMDGD